MIKTRRKNKCTRGIYAGYRLLPLLFEGKTDEFDEGFRALEPRQRLQLVIKMLSYIMPKMKPVPYTKD